jgi:hypothetical protein
VHELCIRDGLARVKVHKVNEFVDLVRGQKVTVERVVQQSAKVMTGDALSSVYELQEKRDLLCVCFF